MRRRNDGSDDLRAAAERLAAAARGLGGDGQLRFGAREMIVLPVRARRRHSAAAGPIGLLRRLALLLAPKPPALP
ncbi:hypothetical protein [Marinivivus vitaminiproducens]|uniref:hypothetical protein n=1 Tax=Marinivivus vitaminiproducens TaxID=3035935 RepID=UPI0027A5BF13|nr:hypothetical protein P4R82_05600 [Geminicoccaceae bacterium SCSIO 64248]